MNMLVRTVKQVELVKCRKKMISVRIQCINCLYFVKGFSWRLMESKKDVYISKRTG